MSVVKVKLNNLILCKLKNYNPIIIDYLIKLHYL